MLNASLASMDQLFYEFSSWETWSQQLVDKTYLFVPKFCSGAGGEPTDTSCATETKGFRIEFGNLSKMQKPQAMPLNRYNCAS